VAWVVLLVVLAAVALLLLLREPFAEWRNRRRQREIERKREWRRQRELERAQRSGPAMNQAKVAARRGLPRWQQVAKRQGSKCWLCGTRTYPDDRQRVDVGAERLGAAYPVVDLVVSIDDGGTFDAENLRIAHRQCSERRIAKSDRADYRAPKRTFRP